MRGEQSVDPMAPVNVLRLFTVPTQSFHLSPPTSPAWTMALVSQSLRSGVLWNTQSVGFTSLPEPGMAARHLKEISACRDSTRLTNS